ncbi:MAG: hypothetical protein IKX06_02510 [Clostridia bacterium]|nr:hypothetical protein [Clostridia bacterium]
MPSEINAFDKETVSEKIVRFLKYFGIALGGGLVGAIPYVVLQCVFSVSSVVTMILCGGGVVAFLAAFAKSSLSRVSDHVIIVLTTLISSLIANVLCVLIHFAPQFEIEGRKMNVFQKTMFMLFHSKADELTKQGLVTDGGAFSIYTILIASAVFAVIGAYAIFLIVSIPKWSRKRK